jgi:hypothetical protein
MVLRFKLRKLPQTFFYFWRGLGSSTGFLLFALFLPIARDGVCLLFRTRRACPARLVVIFPYNKLRVEL